MRKSKLAISASVLAVGMLTGLEGYSPPYLDSANVLTDCYGNTKNVSREHVRTKTECKEMLNSEVGRIANMVLNSVTEPISTQTLASFISFTYNVGDYAFKNSTLLTKYNSGLYYGACRELHRWVYITVAGTKVKLRGLENRRKVEFDLCVEGLRK